MSNNPRVRLLLTLFLCWPLVFIVLEVPAAAHAPVFLASDPSPAAPHQLSPPFEKSIAIYTQFESAEDVDFYEFTLKSEDVSKGPVEILVGTLVPACEPLKNLLTTWALTGPQQQGALTVTNDSQGRVWYEPFTAHYYFYQKRQKVSLTEAGVYRISVWSNSGVAGDYVFEFGDREIWSLGDILRTLWVYPKLLIEGEIVTKDCKTSKAH